MKKEQQNRPPQKKSKFKYFNKLKKWKRKKRYIRHISKKQLICLVAFAAILLGALCYRQLHSFSALYSGAKRQYEQQNYERALKIAEDALDLKPESEAANLLLAKSMEKLGDRKSAILVLKPFIRNKTAGVSLFDMQTSTQLTKDYAELIKSRTVLEGVIAQLNLNITYQQLLGKLTVDTSTDSRIVTIIVSDEDPYTASEMANAIRDMAAEHIQSVMDIEAVNVVDSANIPSEKASPSLAKNGVIGGLLGVIIAMAIVIIIYLTNDTIKVEEDVERYLGLSVLGSIPYSEKESRSKKQKSRKRR